MDGNFLQAVEKFKLPIALSVVGLVLIIGGIFASGIQNPKPKEFPKASLVETSKTISVDVSGAVVTPGVYQLKPDSRIEDAIAAAGGFGNDANKEFISKTLNLAQKLLDGSKVYIPSEEETIGSTGFSQTGVNAGNKASININTSSQAEIEALPGIGPVTASKIISSRPYHSTEDLINNKVVSKAIFEKIKDLVSIY